MHPTIDLHKEVAVSICLASLQMLQAAHSLLVQCPLDHHSLAGGQLQVVSRQLQSGKWAGTSGEVGSDKWEVGSYKWAVTSGRCGRLGEIPISY